MRKLTGKQRWIHSYLTDHPGSAVTEIAEASPPMVRDGEFFRRMGGEPVPSLGYADVYQALKRLRNDGYVTREQPIDQFGDPSRRHHYSITDKPLPPDPLEALLAPEASQ